MKDLKRKIEENRDWNENFDLNLYNTRKLNKKDLNEFIGMFDYGAASTTNWLVSKLKLIKSIIDKGNSVTIEEEPVIILKNQDDLKNWIKSRFDEILIEDVYENK